MPWVRIDEEIGDNAKWMGASLAARGLWVSALAYSGRNLTDGFIPSVWAQREASGEAGQLTDELVSLGLFEHADCGFIIHDYEDYQFSKEQVLAMRSVKIEAGRLGGLASGKARRQAPDEAESKQNRSRIEADANQTEAEAKPIPIPIPIKAIKPSVPSGLIASDDKPPKQSRGTRLPEDWKPDQSQVDFAAEAGLTSKHIEIEGETFRDYWIAQPGQKGVKLDWPATWRNWIRRKVGDDSRRKSNGSRAPNGRAYIESRDNVPPEGHVYTAFGARKD